MNDTRYRSKERYRSTRMDAPIGRLTVAASDRGLAAILWEDDDPQRVPLDVSSVDDAHPILVETVRQLGEYFNGERTTFAIPLDFAGTAFQQSVWRALLTIPFGETRSYGEIAVQIGNTKSVRAVGAANGKNPISIVVPCHRVIGASGALTGFAGGLEVKERLLRLERETASRGAPVPLFADFEPRSRVARRR